MFGAVVAQVGATPRRPFEQTSLDQRRDRAAKGDATDAEIAHQFRLGQQPTGVVHQFAVQRLPADHLADLTVQWLAGGIAVIVVHRFVVIQFLGQG